MTALAGIFAGWGARHPLAAGAVEGLAAAAAVAFVAATMPGAAGAAWAVLLWSALAFDRAPSRQAAAALLLGIGCDALSGNELGRCAVPLLVAMAATGIVRTANSKRWTIDHAAFAGVALVALEGARAVLALVLPSTFGPAPSAVGIAQSVLVFALTCGSAMIVRIVRDVRAPEPRIRSIRPGGRLA